MTFLPHITASQSFDGDPFVCSMHSSDLVYRSQQTGTKRTDLQRLDLSAPGREVVQVRVDFDPGYLSPKHTHPGEEIVYVIEGTLE